jgi:hypothetical protein
MIRVIEEVQLAALLPTTAQRALFLTIKTVNGC